MEESMIFNFLKRSIGKISFNCDPRFHHAFNFFKPDSAYNFAPKWFKNLKPSYLVDGNYGLQLPFGTAKSCPALKSYFTSGFVIPLWTDLLIKVNPDESWYWHSADDMTKINGHTNEQLGGLIKSNKCINIKIMSPWNIKTSDNKEFLFTGAGSFNNDIFSLPDIMSGIMNFNFRHETHINMLLPVQDQSYTIQLNAGMPIVHLINLEKGKYKKDYKLYKSEIEFKQEHKCPIQFSYLKSYKILKNKYSKGDSNESKVN